MAREMINTLEEGRRRPFFPKCPVIDGAPESTSDREYLEMENLRLCLDKNFMESAGVLALLGEERARKKKTATNRCRRACESVAFGDGQHHRRAKS